MEESPNAAQLSWRRFVKPFLVDYETMRALMLEIKEKELRAYYLLFADELPAWYRESIYILDEQICKDPRERLAEGAACRYWPRERIIPHIAHEGKTSWLHYPVFGQHKNPLKVCNSTYSYIDILFDY
jgi:hypothetical protein